MLYGGLKYRGRIRGQILSRNIDVISVRLFAFFYGVMKIQLSDKFNYAKLLRFTLPSIVMMIFTSIYSVVDGYFISHFVGITEFTAINYIMPFTQILGCFGFMFGAGGSGIVSKALGEQNPEKANKIFSMLLYVGVVVGVFFAVIGFIFIRPIAILLGADGDVLPHCVVYGRILLVALPAFMLQNMFQKFFGNGGKTQIGACSNNLRRTYKYCAGRTVYYRI